MNQVATIARDPGDIMESVIVKGDLAKLTPGERAHYYTEVCRSVGLNPLTKPFEYIVLNGKLTLYALRGCTDQLRSIYKVSVVDLAETERDGVYIVTAKVQNSEGRTDMAKGAVTLGQLKGDALANAIMKCETKAKRRATLSICGLGMLDETEIETIPTARRPMAAPVEIAEPEAIAHDPATGEIGPRIVAIPQADDGRQDWIAFGRTIIAGVQSADTAEEASEWHSLNADALGQMAARAPKAYKSVSTAIAARLAALNPTQPSTGGEEESFATDTLAATDGSSGSAGVTDATSPAPITTGERKLLKSLASALAQAMAPATIDKGFAAFIADHKLAEGSSIHAAALAIKEAHRKRVDGESSPVEADQEIMRVLA